MNTASVLVLCGALVLLQLSMIEGAAILKETGTNVCWPKNPKSAFFREEWIVPHVIVPFKTDLLTVDEYAFLSSAMDQLSKWTKKCIRFDSFFEGRDDHFVLFKNDRAAQPPTCRSHLGKMTQDNSKGQLAFAFKNGDKKGDCLTNKRDTLRLLMNILGVANEYQRSDRSSAMILAKNYVELLPEELRDQGILDVNPDLLFKSPFDLNSITMVSGDRFADDAAKAPFRLKKGQEVSTEDKLSRNDCQALDLMYDCRLLKHCDDTGIFQPSNEVDLPPTCQMKIEILNANLNCWPMNQDDQFLTENEQNLGILKILTPFLPFGDCDPDLFQESLASLEFSTSLLGDKIRQSYDNLKQELTISLQRKISKGFTTTIQINGLDEDQNEVVKSEKITVNVNCLPTYATPCDESPKPCPLDQSRVAGTREAVQLASPVVLHRAQCELGDALPSIQLGPFEAQDPDGDLPVFFEMNVSATEGEGEDEIKEKSWRWVPSPSTGNVLSGNVIWNGRALKIPVKLSVTLLIGDAKHQGAGGVKADYDIKCNPARRAGLIVLPIPDY